MKKILKQILRFFYKVFKTILYSIITILIFVFGIFLITLFGFNTWLNFMNKFINKLL